MLELAVLFLFFAYLHPAAERSDTVRAVAGRNLYLSTLIIGFMLFWAGIKGVPWFIVAIGGLSLAFPWVALFAGALGKSHYAQQVLNWIGLILFTFFAVASMFA